MKKNLSKISLGLGILLILDFLKPFDYALRTDFLFLGIIFLALNYPLRSSFILASVFGYLHDCLSYAQGPLSLIEFSITTALVSYLKMRFHQKAARPTIVAVTLFIHAIFNSTHAQGVTLSIILLFFIHSLGAFLVINYLLRKWGQISFEEYI